MLSFALALLASRDYSEGKMLEKLNKKFPNALFEEKNKIITTLKDQKFLDDERLAENWVRYWKEDGKMSIAMMKQKLFQKKISSDTIQKIFETQEISNTKAIQTLAEQKWKSLDTLAIPEIKKKEKLFRFLLGKGFMFSEINAAISEKIEFSDDDF